MDEAINPARKLVYAGNVAMCSKLLRCTDIHSGDTTLTLLPVPSRGLLPHNRYDVSVSISSPIMFLFFLRYQRVTAPIKPSDGLSANPSEVMIPKAQNV